MNADVNNFWWCNISIMIYFLISLALVALLWKIKPYLVSWTTSHTQPKAEAKTDLPAAEKPESVSPATKTPEEECHEEVIPVSEEIKRNLERKITPTRILVTEPSEERENGEVWVGTVRVEEVSFPGKESDNNFTKEDEDEYIVGEEVEDVSSSSVALPASLVGVSDGDTTFLSRNIISGKYNDENVNLAKQNVTTGEATIRRTVLSQSVATKTCKTVSMETNTSVVMETKSVRSIQIKSTVDKSSENTDIIESVEVSGSEPPQEDIIIPEVLPSDDTEKGSFRPKKPVGGICMFGGQELINKIKQRRIALEGSEAEEDKQKELQMNGKEDAKDTDDVVPPPFNEKNETKAHQEEDNTPQVPMSEDKGAGKEELFSELLSKNHVEKDSLDSLCHSSPSSPDKLNNADAVGSDDGISLSWKLNTSEGSQMVLLPTDGEALIHLNKDRPKGPPKRRPSLNAGRSLADNPNHDENQEKNQ